MEETELLEALDRRAGRAVGALEDGLADAEPPPLPVTRPRRRPWLPLLVAAALIVVALVGVGMVLTGGDDQEGTVADDRDVPVETAGEITRLVLAEPAALGYEVRAAFDGSAVPVDPASGPPAPGYTAHGPSGAADPWRRAIVTQTTPWDEQVYTGEVVDLAGVEGVHRALGPLDQVAWRDGDQARTLASSTLDRDELIAVARTAVGQGWAGEGPLPDHVILHQGGYEDFGQIIEFGSSWRSPWQGVAYDDMSTEDDIVVAWRRGGPALLGSLHVFDPDVETVEVDGQHISVSKNVVRGASHATWEPVEGTVVALATYGDIRAVLREVVPAMVPIDIDEFRAMVAAKPSSPEVMLLDAPESAFEQADGEAVASIEIPDRAGYSYQVRIVEGANGGFALMQETGDGNGTSGSGGPLTDLSTPMLQAGSLSDEQTGTSTPLIVSGVLPAGVAPDLPSARFVDRTTGAEVAVLDFVTGSIPGSSHLLGLILLDAEPPATGIDVTFQTPDGERTWRL